MYLVIGVVILGVFFFICCINYSFQKVQYKSRCQNRNYSIFNSPGAWVSYAIITAITIVLLFSLSFSNMYNGFSSMFNAASDAKSEVVNSTVTESADTSSSETETEK